MPPRVPIVGGNWKCNGTFKSTDDLVAALKAGSWDTDKVEVVVAPVLLHVPRVQAALKGTSMQVSVQNISATATGAFTGEVAATQVKDFGLDWVIIGHSERRAKFGESDATLAKKLEHAQKEGLNAIFCIGETLEEREAEQTNDVLDRQLSAVFPVIKDWAKIVIAYEPVWAIGTGKVATPAQAQDTHAHIRSYISWAWSPLVAEHVRIQYGGSVSPDNCKELIALPDVDGFLVGGAALKPSFVQIIQAAADGCTGVVAAQPLPKVGAGIAGPLTLIVLDGYGIGPEYEGNCVYLANPENLTKYAEESKTNKCFTELAASGTAVGLPEDADMGNSEVGHNALGAGQCIAQGARLVNDYLQGELFGTDNWKSIVASAKSSGGTVHLFGLLSDGGVHSNINHLYTLLDHFATEGVQKVRCHVVTDGRDVSPHSSELFVPQLEAKLAEKTGLDYRVASGGGRMYVSMDRYNADWDIVKRGWDSMVHGSIDPAIVPEIGVNGYTGKYTSMSEWRAAVRQCFADKSDQNYPPFVVVDEKGEAVGKVKDGDMFINFNFRGDRALEISRAFIDTDFTAFDRGVVPKADYYGMLIYDNDVGIPKKSLCPNPDIRRVLSEFMVASNVPMYAISETQKFGHVTFFWNGNRSGYFDESQEKYVEVPSDPATPEMISEKPGMKCVEISDKLVAAIEEGTYKFYRVNYPNPDMAGHTGLIAETTQSIVTMDAQVKRVVDATLKRNGAVIITADHGNAECMLDKKGGMVTSHTCNAVPFMLLGKTGCTIDTAGVGRPALTNVAATVCTLLGLEAPALFDRTLAARL